MSTRSTTPERLADWREYLDFSGTDPYSFAAARARVILVRSIRAKWIHTANLPDTSLPFRWRRPTLLPPLTLGNMTWDGQPDRDKCLDNLPRSEWAKLQFMRTIRGENDAPTFTGPMIAKHLHTAIGEWRAGRDELLFLQSTILAIKDGLKMLELWYDGLEKEIRDVEEDVSRLQTLEELAVDHLAIGKFP
ncbi:hypothetical protein VKT23_004360 [Stygiomarasmius scandens]|uniref:Uncharacterized protein n=1 Tax=Marasmiellus scandens TaxID=2682957 RepID=A0ABR1JVS3_9AGAR